MGYPRVFVSSTCYDLAQIRDSLSEFIDSYCYEPILSERGDVFYHPDLHTHECCINEIENCNLFILIIGGRFGGNYKFDIDKSITNAEYEAARLKNVPIFTFIKRELYDDHRVYQKNRNNLSIINEIVFPSVENQKYAGNIFEFINQVRLSECNNGFFAFEYVNDIKQYLAKQWAGMMFNFLNDRLKEKSQKVLSSALDNLSLLNKKTEELLENIILKINPKDGGTQIKDIDRILLASKFFKEVFRMFAFHVDSYLIETISLIETANNTWYNYVAKIDKFKIIPAEESQGSEYKTISVLSYGHHIWSVVTEDNVLPPQVVKVASLYENLKGLNVEERKKALKYTQTITD